MNETIAYMHERRSAPDYRHPHADLGYCQCGTVWNIDAMEQCGFQKGKCPDCGEDPIEIEKAEQRPSD